MNSKITPDWTVSVNGNIRYSYIRNRLMEAQKNKGIGGNANINTSYLFNKRISIMAYAGFFRTPISLQFNYPLNVWYGVGASHKFFKEKLTTSLRLTNMLQKEFNYKMTTRDASFMNEIIYTKPYRHIVLNVAYKFGKLTEKVSKKKGINNDDLIGNNQNNN